MDSWIPKWAGRWDRSESQYLELDSGCHKGSGVFGSTQSRDRDQRTTHRTTRCGPGIRTISKDRGYWAWLLSGWCFSAVHPQGQMCPLWMPSLTGAAVWPEGPLQSLTCPLPLSLPVRVKDQQHKGKVDTAAAHTASLLWSEPLSLQHQWNPRDLSERFWPRGYDPTCVASKGSSRNDRLVLVHVGPISNIVLEGTLGLMVGQSRWVVLRVKAVIGGDTLKALEGGLAAPGLCQAVTAVVALYALEGVLAP